jgi:hypothetical protein
MSERLGLSTVADLEAALLDLGAALGCRRRRTWLRSPGQTPSGRHAPSVLPARRIRGVRRSLLLAAALALLLAGAALGVRSG